MELIRVKNASYGRYEDLLLMRDQLERESDSILTAYTAEFGDLIAKIFEEKIACIRQKKAIAYAQQQINRGESVNVSEMNAALDRSMKLYEEELKRMLQENKKAKKAGTSSPVVVQRAKRLYRKLARLIHPDIDPRTKDIPVLMDLWNRVVIAYHKNDAGELENLEVLIRKAMTESGMGQTEVDIPDIEERIEELETEINDILTTEPYVFREFLEDRERAGEKKAELQKEYEEYCSYHAELDAVLENLMAEGGERFIWKIT